MRERGRHVAVLFRASVLNHLRHFHAGVEVEVLLHHLVSGERDGDHRDGPQIIDRHAPVQAVHDSVLAVDKFQRADHADAAKRGKTR